MNYTFINYPTLLLKTSHLLHHLEENFSPQHSMQGQVYKTWLGPRPLSATPPHSTAPGHARLRWASPTPRGLSWKAPLPLPVLESLAQHPEPTEPLCSPRMALLPLLGHSHSLDPVTLQRDRGLPIFLTRP